MAQGNHQQDGTRQDDVKEELIQFFVVAYSQHDVPGNDSDLLVIARSVARELCF